MSDIRERLLRLEAEDKFLFHGSPLLFKELAPQQPVNFDRKTGEMRQDGDPCVAATHIAEIAIFRAIVNSRNFPGKSYGSSFRVTPKGNSELTVTRKVWKRLEGKMGYVYILPRNEFSKHSRMEWRSEHEVRPLEIIAVSAKDLPKNIKVKWWL